MENNENKKMTAREKVTTVAGVVAIGAALTGAAMLSDVNDKFEVVGLDRLEAHVDTLYSERVNGVDTTTRAGDKDEKYILHLQNTKGQKSSVYITKEVYEKTKLGDTLTGGRIKEMMELTTKVATQIASNGKGFKSKFEKDIENNRIGK
jgi:hypothetical protein